MSVTKATGKKDTHSWKSAGAYYYMEHIQMVCEHVRNKEVITRHLHDFLKASHAK